MDKEMINAFSVDVEDYWKILSHDWLDTDTEPTEAVVRNTNRILSILESQSVKATFFVLGEVAGKFPDLVRQIIVCGHEVGIHGYKHFVIYTINRKKFYKEVSDAKKLMEDIIGQRVDGHRAPSFSIMPQTQWALEVLSEVGFLYDSSVFPFKGRRYGWPGFNRHICEIKLPNDAKIIEVPMSTTNIFGKTIPACGGGYLRVFPYFYTRWAIQRIQQEQPIVVYMHPYDIDTAPGPQHIKNLLKKGPLRSKIRHKIQIFNRRTVELKLKRLLREYRFAPIREVIADVLGNREDNTAE